MFASVIKYTMWWYVVTIAMYMARLNIEKFLYKILIYLWSPLKYIRKWSPDMGQAVSSNA